MSYQCSRAKYSISEIINQVMSNIASLYIYLIQYEEELQWLMDERTNNDQILTF